MEASPQARPRVSPPRRRTQQERTETTVTALVDAGRALFASHGYADTSVGAVVAKAGLTKGAFYHHFDSKRDLFRAVYLREQERFLEVAIQASARKRDPWDAFEAGCRAFFEAALDPEVQRITLLDAPAALGWSEMHSIESANTIAVIQRGLSRAMDADRLPRRPVEPLANLLFGAICQGAIIVARADDQRAAQRAIVAELHTLLASLAERPD